MSGLQRAGGIAALCEALIYVFGFVLFLGVLDYSGYDGPEGRVAFLVDNRVTLYVGNLVIYVLFGIALVVLTVALADALRQRAPALSAVAAAFGLIWAALVIASGMIANVGIASAIDVYASDPTQAATMWLALSAVGEGLGGGNEIVGGVWVLLVSIAGLRARRFPRPLHWLGLVVGSAGVLTVVPALEIMMAVFGLTQIVWFAWLGVARKRK